MTRWPPRRILVPSDLSAPALTALETAKALARRFDAHLDLVHVQEVPMSLLGASPETSAASASAMLRQLQEFRRWRTEKLAEAVEDLPRGRARVRDVQGWVSPVVAGMARGPIADLVVMGTHGWEGWERALYGSFTESVAHRAKVPVLAVHAGKPLGRAPRVLAPFNFEPYASTALRVAAGVARSLRVDLTAMFVAPDGMTERAAGESLAEGVARALGKDAKGVERVVRHGEARHAILREAERGGYGLVALSAHLKPFSTDWVLGTTAERVIRHCSLPVLCVPSR